MVSAKNIFLSFNNKEQIFKNFSFEIDINEHVCFAGASGKGKSSILKLLQGYVLPQSGVIKINDIELTTKNIGQIRSMIAYIPQNINLPVKNGVELLKLLELKRNHKYIHELLGEFGLEKGFLDRSFDEISGGQKQRIIIAVCLSLNRKIVLLDEPTASLDKASTQKLINLINKLENTTIISASHNPEWIKSANKTIDL